MQISEWERHISRKEGELALLVKQQQELDRQMQDLAYCKQCIEEAQALLQGVAKQTQNRLSFHISNFVTSALQSIWDEKAYRFTLEFVEKRNKTEVLMQLHTEDGTVSLENLSLVRSGGGVLDVTALALRIALWSLKNPKKHVMLLDQPLTNLDNEHIPLAGQLIQELSRKLGIQFIMVNHLALLNEYADTSLMVEKLDGVSVARSL